MKKIVFLIGFLAISSLAVAAGVSISSGNAAAGDQENAQKSNPEMKNVILIGANGRTSAEIIPRLLQQEDVRLTLFLRRASRLQHLESERVDVVDCDAGNIADLRGAIRGKDIVISTMETRIST